VDMLLLDELLVPNQEILTPLSLGATMATYANGFWSIDSKSNQLDTSALPH